MEAQKLPHYTQLAIALLHYKYMMCIMEAWCHWFCHRFQISDNTHKN